MTFSTILSIYLTRKARLFTFKTISYSSQITNLTNTVIISQNMIYIITGKTMISMILTGLTLWTTNLALCTISKITRRA